MEQDPNTHYDAKLVVLADGDLDKKDMQLFTGSEWIKDPEAFLFYALNKVYSDVGQLKGAYDEEIVKAIVDGRFKLSTLLLLLDSPGGSVESYRELIEFIELVKNQGGDVVAFLKSAAGLPAHLFLEADERYMINKSIANLLLPQGTDEEFEWERMEAFKKLFIDTTDDPHTKQSIKRYIEMFHQDRDDINFGNWHFEQFGLAEVTRGNTSMTDLLNFIRVFERRMRIVTEIDIYRTVHTKGEAGLNEVMQQHEFSDDFQRRLATFFSKWTRPESDF